MVIILKVIRRRGIDKQVVILLRSGVSVAKTTTCVALPKVDSIVPILDVQIKKVKSRLDLFSTNQKQLLPTHI